MMKVRALLVFFGLFCLGIGVGTIGIVKEVVWLAAFGSETTARISEIYQQNADEAGGWFIVYEYRVGGQKYTDAAPAFRTDRVGSRIPIRYLAKSPAVSNTRREVRLGRILGPIGALPVGIILAFTGIWLLAKALFASALELRNKTEPEAETGDHGERPLKSSPGSGLSP